MATSKIVLPNGTIITIEGKPEEIKTVLSAYGHIPVHAPAGKETRPMKKRKHTVSVEKGDDTDSTVEIVNSIKESDEADNIETSILDRSSQIDRILLPLYISHKYHANKYALTTGEIAKVLVELGVPIGIANISNEMKASASKYVVGDKTRKRGQAVRYKLSRRGVQYMSAVISGHGD